MSEDKFLTIFKSSIFKTKVECEKSKKYFLDLLKNEKDSPNSSMHISNKGGFQTRPFSYVANDDINKTIFINPCIEFLNNFYKRKSMPEWGIRMTSFWINENHKADYNVMHNHLPNNFSGIWYLKAPKDCGKLVFQNGDTSSLNDVNFDYFNDPHFFSRFFLEVEDNDLIIFPAHMLHYVEPSRTDEDRISLAFNIKIEKM